MRSRSVVAAVVEVKTLQERVRLLSLEAEERKGLMPRLERLEEKQQTSSEHITALARDTLKLGTELKLSLAALEAELNTTATAAEERLESLVQTMDEQLQGMQGFIVRAAEDAKARRVNFEAAVPTMLSMVDPNGIAASGIAANAAATNGGATEMAALMEQQRQAQTVFAARRRAAAEANFPGPGAGVTR
ncbi:MAG: hypothetical protein LW834_17535 [Cyanobium sp. 49614_E6]|nr:hypothetical protein [Cyanobium sp. 49614_E6]MCE2838727.1 hypothetical protein [Cyanobium sp. 49614_E6]